MNRRLSVGGDEGASRVISLQLDRPQRIHLIGIRLRGFVLKLLIVLIVIVVIVAFSLPSFSGVLNEELYPRHGPLSFRFVFFSITRLYIGKEILRSEHSKLRSICWVWSVKFSINSWYIPKSYYSPILHLCKFLFFFKFLLSLLPPFLRPSPQPLSLNLGCFIGSVDLLHAFLPLSWNTVKTNIFIS